jgi:hypothetical protein
MAHLKGEKWERVLGQQPFDKNRRNLRKANWGSEGLIYFE